MPDYRNMSAALDFLNLKGDMLVMQLVFEQQFCRRETALQFKPTLEAWRASK
jgi:hypothetical protein